MDVLSQSEIDALLVALSNGEMSAEELKKEDDIKKVKSYNFKRAVKFSKDHIRSLTRIHENFARYLTTFFSAQLRTFVQINNVQVEQLPYEEFIRSIPKMTILYIFEADPLEGRMVLELNPNIAFAMLDRLLGGTGTSPLRADTLTDIETTILERVFHKAFSSLQEAWKGVIDINPRLATMETNPQFMQIASPNETIALISLTTKIGETTGMINLCIPHVVIEPIMPRLSAHHWFVSQKKTAGPEEIETIKARLHKAELPVVAELGDSVISVNELLNLSIGDVITLNTSVDNKLQLRVGDRVKYLASPGVVKGRNAVQITEILSEGVDESDRE